MPKEFKYDVVHLIAGVRVRPCLWDKTLENYKDRVERKVAWEEIFNELEPQYVEMSPEMKRITSELILNKWTNIRDTFVKTLKMKMGRPKKKYVLYEHLKFLTKIVPEEDRLNFMEFNSEEMSVTYFKSDKDISENNISESTSTSKPKKRKKVRKTTKIEENITPNDDEVEDDIIFLNTANDNNVAEQDESDIEIDTTVADDPRIMNEDEAFFASLLPTVVKYDEEEKLEFRIDVLAAMKKIKDKRKWKSDG